MSGYSEQQECPKCGGQMTVYDDWKPQMFHGEWCYECGYRMEATEGKRMTLKEVNAVRIDNGDEPLEKLAEQER